MSAATVSSFQVQAYRSSYPQGHSSAGAEKDRPMGFRSTGVGRLPVFRHIYIYVYLCVCISIKLMHGNKKNGFLSQPENGDRAKTVLFRVKQSRVPGADPKQHPKSWRSEVNSPNGGGDPYQRRRSAVPKVPLLLIILNYLNLFCYFVGYDVQAPAHHLICKKGRGIPWRATVESSMHALRAC